MARRVTVHLTQAQRAELLALRSEHPKAYVRERVAAILQIADGKTVGDVAHKGLLTQRQDETVSAWVKRYVTEGTAGLVIRAGRGRPTKLRRSSAKKSNLSTAAKRED